MKSMVIEEFQRLRELIQNGEWRSKIREIIAPEAGPFWQFAKYLVIGSASVFVFLGASYLLRWIGRPLDPDVTAHRLLWLFAEITAGFIAANAFTYQTNRRWVFKTGRHSKNREFFLFTITAAGCFVAAQFLVYLLTSMTNANDLTIKLAVIALSTILNFMLRKTIVFIR